MVVMDSCFPDHQMRTEETGPDKSWNRSKNSRKWYWSGGKSTEKEWEEHFKIVAWNTKKKQTVYLNTICKSDYLYQTLFILVISHFNAIK